jgi:hypothetical protein
VIVVRRASDEKPDTTCIHGNRRERPEEEGKDDDKTTGRRCRRHPRLTPRPPKNNSRPHKKPQQRERLQSTEGGGNQPVPRKRDAKRRDVLPDRRNGVCEHLAFERNKTRCRCMPLSGWTTGGFSVRMLRRPGGEVRSPAPCA